MADNKLHAILAVEKDIRNLFGNLVTEGKKTFESRSSHFIESRKSYQPLNAEDTDLPDTEFVPIVTTVKEKLDYIQGTIVKLMDIELQKEKANQEAKSDLVVTQDDGAKVTILTDVPVTLLVQFEGVLENIRGLYHAIPTLDPAKVWKKDPNRENIFIADPVTRVRTKKVTEVIVKAPSTDKFPAQTELVTVDKKVGDWTHDFSSGALSPKQKSQLLRRIDQLISGVKIARAKANETLVGNYEIGQQIFNFINEGFKVQ